MTFSASKSMRLQIGLFGRSNVGKSSFLNLITGQNAAIVSPVAGTTTDVVEKAMELLPVGPVMFLDTAGIDDKSTLGQLRVDRTKALFSRADVAVLIVEANIFGPYEEEIVCLCRRHETPIIFEKCAIGSSTSFLASVGGCV